MRGGHRKQAYLSWAALEVGLPPPVGEVLVATEGEVAPFAIPGLAALAVG